MKQQLSLKHILPFTFISVLFFASHAFSFTSYYVSTLGGDSNNGTSASTPWKTISKVNAASLSFGDAIYFRAGDTFTGQINLTQSGVTLGNYGGSVKPVISGGTQLSGWTVYSGSIYKAQAPAYVKNLFSNGVQMTLARYPNTGFLKVESTDGLTTLTASGLNQAPGYWNGATIRLRTTAFTYEIRPVSSFDGVTLTLPVHATNFPSDFSFGIAAGAGFYLDNKLAALDVAEEWFCDPSTNVVYFYAPDGVNPASLTVTATTEDYGVNCTGSTVTIEGLDVRYQALSGIRFSGTTSDNKILSNVIFGQNVQGIAVEDTSSSYTIDGNTLQNLNGRGIYLESAQSSIISNNTVKCVGLVPGYGIDNENGESGIVLKGGANSVIRANLVDSTGYTGICSDGRYHLVENNVVKNVMLTLSDGGALYSYNENQLTYGTVWRNNIIINAVGNIESWNSITPAPQADGLYWDFRCHDMTAEGNTVINATSNGLFMQYACYNNTIRNNTFYNCSGNGAYLSINSLYTYGGNRVAGNTFYTKADRQSVLSVVDPTAIYHPFGTLDSNTYCNPTDSTSAVSRVYAPSGYVKVDYTVEQWQSFTGDEAHSTPMYKQPLTYEHDTIVVNQTGSSATIALSPYLYHDVKGNVVSLSVVLAPYTSRILIRDTVRASAPLPAVRDVSPLSNTSDLSDLPHEFALGRNYPNPFNPSTSIAYDIPSHAHVLLKIYDVAGREVATLVNQEMETGKYSVQWNASSFPSGVYFYRLTAGNFTSVKKLLLQK